MHCTDLLISPSDPPDPVLVFPTPPPPLYLATHQQEAPV